MATVYILNKGAHDFSAAKKYGDIVYCTDGSLSKYNTSQMFRECSAAMAESKPEDLIVLTSLSSLCSIACALFAARHQRLNLLLFKDEDYIVRKLVFDN